MKALLRKSLVPALLLTLLPTFAQATPFSRNVSTASALTTALSDYQAGSYTSGEIVLTANITVTTNVTIDGLSNLTLRGNSASFLRRLHMSSSASTAEHTGTLRVLHADNIHVHDLDIKAATGRNKRSVEVSRSDNVHLKNLELTPASNNPKSSVALIVARTTDIVVNDVNMSGFYGSGIVLRRVLGFEIANCDITDMKNAMLSTIPVADQGSNVGIQVDEDGTGTSTSGNGRIGANTFTSLPGQGIFVDAGHDIVIESNDMDSIGVGVGCAAGVDCGGRGIYVETGSDFWIRDNTIDGVDEVRVGGGINAGSPLVSDVLIESNTIKWTGNTSHANLSPTQNDWNGWGISVRNRAVVEWNTIHHSSTYGILIQPGANDVLIHQNEVRYSGLDNIKATAGFTYQGQYVLTGEPTGPLDNILIRDNFLADADGYAVRVEPRSKQELIDNPNLSSAQRNAWQNSWAQFDVKLRDNSLHRNDNGNVGIRILAPDVNYAPPVTPTYFISYLHSGYNGQSPYSSVDSGLQSLNSVNWNDFPHLDSTLCAIQFPTVSSSDVFGSDNSAACP